MAYWLVELEGEKFDLEEYPINFREGGVYAIEENGKYYLKGPDLDRIGDADGVLKKARESLISLTGILTLQMSGLRMPEMHRVSRVEDDNTRKETVIVSFTTVARAKSTAHSVGGAASCVVTRSERLLQASDASVHLKTARDLWADTERSWPRLYRILEEIENHLSRQVNEVGFCTKARRDLFTRTANNAEVAGKDSRHGLGKFTPPAVPMPVADAIEFISNMLESTLNKESEKI